MLPQAMRLLGGETALLKVQATKVLELCAREAAQIFGAGCALAAHSVTVSKASHSSWSRLSPACGGVSVVSCLLLRIDHASSRRRAFLAATGGASFVRGGKGERVERIYRELRAVAIAGGSEEIMQDLAVREAMKRWNAKQAKLPAKL